jgi:hypothetical protein
MNPYPYIIFVLGKCFFLGLERSFGESNKYITEEEEIYMRET